MLLVLAGLAVGGGLGAIAAKSMVVTCTTSTGGMQTIKPTNWDVNSGQRY